MIGNISKVHHHRSSRYTHSQQGNLNWCWSNGHNNTETMIRPAHWNNLIYPSNQTSNTNLIWIYVLSRLLLSRRLSFGCCCCKNRPKTSKSQNTKQVEVEVVWLLRSPIRTLGNRLFRFGRSRVEVDFFRHGQIFVDLFVRIYPEHQSVIKRTGLREHRRIHFWCQKTLVFFDSLLNTRNHWQSFSLATRFVFPKSQVSKHTLHKKKSDN